MEKILIVAGTNRKKSLSREVAEIYKQLLADMGCESDILDLQDLPPDFTSTALYDQAGRNNEFNEFRKQMAEARKFVFIVPEYNGSFPGVLKSFIDGLQFPDSFKDKKCAIVGISSGSLGAGLAISHLTDIFNYCGMHVLAIKPRLTGINRVLDGRKIKSDLYMSLLTDQAKKLITF